MKAIYKKILPLIAAATSLVSPTSAQIIAPFKAGDRVAFVGNSITDGGHYHSYIWLYYMTRFPNMRITCFNAGIGGDAINNIADRFDDDVLAKKPNVLTLTWGMNDSGYFSLDNLPKHTALGYIKDVNSQKWRTNAYSIPIKGGSDGGAYITAPDMVKFWEALFNNEILSR